MKRKLKALIIALEIISALVLIGTAVVAIASSEYIKQCAVSMITLLICVGIEIIMEIEDKQ
jgi:hypothetical protein